MSATAKAAAGLLAVGIVALLLAESTVLQVAAALVLLVGVGTGVFAIATPDFVAGERDD